MVSGASFIFFLTDELSVALVNAHENVFFSVIFVNRPISLAAMMKRKSIDESLI